MMANASINSCPVCNGNHWTHVCTCDAGEGDSFEVLLCPDCGLIKRFPSASNVSTGIYAIEETLLTNPRKGIINRSFNFFQRLWNRQKARITEREAGRVSGVLLDVGCHKGDFIATMRRRGWIAHGIESDDKARTYGESHYNLHIEKSEMLYRIQPKSYNVVTAWDFLGRTNDLPKSFRALCNLITSDGTLIVALYHPTPTIASDHKETWFRLMAHSNFLLGSKALRLLAADNNMQIVNEENSMAMTMASATACQLLYHTYNRQAEALWTGYTEGLKVNRAYKHATDNGCYIIYTLKHNTLPQ